MLASAGVMGIIVGLAAKPIFENAMSSMIIAITQPILLDDEVVIDGEYGRIGMFLPNARAILIHIPQAN